MASKFDHSAGDFETENTGGLLTGFLAEEEELDRPALLRLGTWGAAAVGAVIAALIVNPSGSGLRREQLATADLARQSQQMQSLAKESQNETRRLASAIDTLNGDRDRLFSRVSVLEQGLDSVTGAIARQSPSPTLPAVAAPSAKADAKIDSKIDLKTDAKTELQTAAQNPAPAPVVTPVTAMPAAPATTAPIARPNSPPTPQAAAAPSAKIDAKPEAKTETKTESKSEAKTEPQAVVPNPAPAAMAPVAPAAPTEKPAA